MIVTIVFTDKSPAYLALFPALAKDLPVVTVTRVLQAEETAIT